MTTAQTAVRESLCRRILDMTDEEIEQVAHYLDELEVHEPNDETDGIIENAITDSQKQKEALHRLYSGLKAINDEPLDDEFDSFMAKGFNITRELDL